VLENDCALCCGCAFTTRLGRDENPELCHLRMIDGCLMCLMIPIGISIGSTVNNGVSQESAQKIFGPAFLLSACLTIAPYSYCLLLPLKKHGHTVRGELASADVIVFLVHFLRISEPFEVPDAPISPPNFLNSTTERSQPREFCRAWCLQHHPPPDSFLFFKRISCRDLAQQAHVLDYW